MGKTVFVLVHVHPPAAVGRNAGRVRVRDDETNDSALERLAGATCSASAVCHLLAAEQDIEQNGENCYTMLHRRVMRRQADGYWEVQAEKSWDMTMEETMASLASADP